MKNTHEINTLRLKLKRIMSDHGLTQNDVARKTGVSQGAISNFLTDKRGFSGEYALRIAKFIAGLDTHSSSCGIKQSTAQLNPPDREEGHEA